MRMTTWSLIIAVVGLCAAIAESALAQPELYTGALIDNTEGFADFNESLKGQGGEPRNACLDEGGMHFTGVYEPCDPGGFMGLAYCGGNGTPALYFNAGERDIMGITRLDGEDFDAIEFLGGDGFVANCVLSFLWIRGYNDGVPIADFTIDLFRWDIVGIRGGGFDELRVGAYSTAHARNLAYEARDERAYQALAIDNVRFGTIGPPPPTLALTGSCPGTMTADVSGAIPAGRVAFIAGRCTNETTIPTGPCAGTILPIGNAVLVGTVTADGNGAATLTGTVPPSACGRVCLLALDVAGCQVSNVVRIE